MKYDLVEIYALQIQNGIYFTPINFVLTNGGGFQIGEQGAGHMLAGASLAEERIERIVATADTFVAGHLAVRLDPVLQTKQLPASITDLDTALANMD